MNSELTIKDPNNITLFLTEFKPEIKEILKNCASTIKEHPSTVFVVPSLFVAYRLGHYWIDRHYDRKLATLNV